MGQSLNISSQLTMIVTVYRTVFTFTSRDVNKQSLSIGSYVTQATMSRSIPSYAQAHVAAQALTEAEVSNLHKEPDYE